MIAEVVELAKQMRAEREKRRSAITLRLDTTFSSLLSSRFSSSICGFGRGFVEIRRAK
ncbi:MAG: hypothetical protein M3P83_13420 [Actinomycetota bacterium]|nr:hypothetical protein [Actinomycetota bacterium]